MNEKKNTVQDIISLLDAGYSREEISELLSGQNAEEPVEEPAEDIPAEDPAEPEETPEPVPGPDEVEKLKEEVKTLKAMIQRQNLKQTKVEKIESEPTASEILARLINPDYHDGGKIK